MRRHAIASTSTRHRRWLGLIACCAALVLLCAAPRAWAGQAAVTWEECVDAYLDGRFADAAHVVELSPDDLLRQARESLDRWIQAAQAAAPGAPGRAVRRVTLRRVQGAAALPLAILLPLSGDAAHVPHAETLELVSVEASTRLGRDDLTRMQRADDADALTRQRRFRVWWQIVHRRYLLNMRRLADFRWEGWQLNSADVDLAYSAESSFLRGNVDELRARVYSNAIPDVDGFVGATRERQMMQGFGSAADWYRRALRAAPDHAEARLHLGRVQIDLGRLDAAVATLRPLATPPCESTPCALAALFMGQALELRGTTDEASAAYALASSRPEVRLSALAALMHLAVVTGDTTGGAALIGQLTQRPSAPHHGPDAWSVHVAGRRKDSRGVLEFLYGAIIP